MKPVNASGRHPSFIQKSHIYRHENASPVRPQGRVFIKMDGQLHGNEDGRPFVVTDAGYAHPERIPPGSHSGKHSNRQIMYLVSGVDVELQCNGATLERQKKEVWFQHDFVVQANRLGGSTILAELVLFQKQSRIMKRAPCEGNHEMYLKRLRYVSLP